MALHIREEVDAIGGEIIEMRRYLHQHPELGLEEFETAAFVAEKLTALGMDVSTNVGKTGVVGLLRGEEDGPCVGLRADMDALPMQETGNVPYRSLNDGVMHACGHDGHMAMLLGAATVLSEMKARLRGAVKFIFQPAEEGQGGARLMIAGGVLKDPDVDEMYGIHLWNYQDFGTIGVKEGPVLAAADEFTFTVKGRGGHGAAPHGTVDAVVVVAHLITALQTIVSRNTNPLESTVVTIGQIEGGYNFNIIADEVVLNGTARAYTERNRQMVKQRLKEVSQGVAASFGADIALDYRDAYPPTINTAKTAKNVSDAARRIVGDGVQAPYMTMGGEDMAYYLQKVPGCFFFVGSSPKGKKTGDVPHHCSRFDIDERALLVGTSVWVQLVENLLIRD